MDPELSETHPLVFAAKVKRTAALSALSAISVVIFAVLNMHLALGFADFAMWLSVMWLYIALQESLELESRQSVADGKKSGIPKHRAIQVLVSVVGWISAAFMLFGWYSVFLTILHADENPDMLAEYSWAAWVAILTLSINALAYILSRQLWIKFNIDPALLWPAMRLWGRRTDPKG